MVSEHNACIPFANTPLTTHHHSFDMHSHAQVDTEDYGV